MTNAVWTTKIHPRKQVERREEMSEHDYHETSCAK
jgi:hypothetical protein